MTTRIQTLIERLQITTTLDELQELVENLRDVYKITHVVYHIVGDSGTEYGVYTYDQKWVDHYISKKYYRTDPVVTESLKRFHPIDWRTLDWSGRQQRNLMQEAIENGIGKQGLSLPIRGANGKNALFSVTSFANDKEWDKFLAENSEDMILAAHYIHQRASEIMGALPDLTVKDLSPREKDALTLLASGKSRAEAANCLKISEHTFRVYVDTARHKLGALNTTHAVAVALSRGVILP